VYLVVIKEVTDSKVCPPGHSVLISYSASGAQLIRLTELKDKPRNLRNDIKIHVDSTKPLDIQNVQLKSGPYFNMSNLFTKIYDMLYYTINLYLQ
jgi:hypothetical protein